MFDPRVKRGNTFAKPPVGVRAVIAWHVCVLWRGKGIGLVRLRLCVSQLSQDTTGPKSPVKTRKVKPATSIFDIKPGQIASTCAVMACESVRVVQHCR